MRQPLSIQPDQLEDIARKQQNDKAASQGGLSQALKKTSSAGQEGGESTWKVPYFPEDVDVLKEKTRAFLEAKVFMDSLLGEDDMEVQLSDADVSGVPTGTVVNRVTGAEINTYEGMDLLKVYAQNAKPKGLIVDGIV